MLDEGYVFESVPSFHDFEQLLERSLIELSEPLPRNVLLDRCPIDYLAYLADLTRVKAFLPRRWIREVNQTMSHVDLVVYVPIERPERVLIHAEEGRAMRRRVDEAIREMLVEDSWGFGVKVIEVRGTPEERKELVLAHLADVA